MEKSRTPSSRLNILTAGFQLAKLLLFVSPEQRKSAPDRRVNQLAARIAKLTKEDATTSHLAPYGHRIHHFLKDFRKQTENLNTGERVLGKLSFHSFNDRPVVDALIGNINGTLCGRADIKDERSLHTLMYPIPPQNAAEAAALPPVLTDYEDFTAPYAVRGTDPEHLQGILFPVVSPDGQKVPGTYVEYSGGGLGRRSNIGSMPFYITFVVLPRAEQ